MTTLNYAGVPYEEIVSVALLDELLPRITPNWSVLDIGISAGHAISPLAFAGLNVTGVDINSRALSFCHKEFERAGIKNKLTTVNMDAMQFLDTNTKKFDVVCMADFLMFFTKTKAIELVSSAYRAVKKAGLMWIVTKSTNDDLFGQVSWMTPIDTDTFQIQSGCHGLSTICFFRPGEVDKLLRDLGFNVLFSGESVNRAGGVVNTILAKKENL